MRKPCILRILSNVLAHQAEMANILATQWINDQSQRNRLHEAVLANQAEFKRLVPEFQMQIEPRRLPAARAK